LAFYSYAHVPWIKGNGQRGFNDEDIPKDDKKRALYETGKKLLSENGYHEIGMDHFALRLTVYMMLSKMAHTVISWDTVRLKHN
jgi:coproporphyrinogen III oxidase-like Fe-S oxidoreductase